VSSEKLQFPTGGEAVGTAKPANANWFPD